MSGKRKTAKKTVVKRTTTPISKMAREVAPIPAGFRPVTPYLSIRAQARPISDPVIHGSV